MAGIFNRAIFNDAIFNTATAESAASVGGGRAKPWRQKWRQELVELLADQELKPVAVPRRVRRAIQRVLEAAPIDDSGAKSALRGELDRLKVSYTPAYLDALRYEAAKRYRDEMDAGMLARAQELDDEEAIFVLLH